MPIRLRHKHDTSNNTEEMVDPVIHETTVDGQTFAWGPGEEKTFMDDGVGLAHAIFDQGTGDYVFENNSLVTIARSESFPSRS